MAEARSGDARALVAPELLAALDLFPTLHFEGDGLARVRAGMGSVAERPSLPEALTAVACEERFVPGAAGDPDVRLLVYAPPRPATSARPAYLNIHGGGYVIGTADISDAACRSIALEHDCVVVSVDYRLAPETRFPGALADCYAALRWLHAEATALAVDMRRIAVGGESAGAGHAAALALLARERGEVPVCFQLLDSPMLDDRTGSVGAPHPVCGRLGWTAAHNRFGWGALLGREPGGADVAEAMAPARARELAGLPPTFLAIGALDLFLDETLDYARRLAHAGVPVELHVIPGAYHGFGIAGPDAPQVRMLQTWRREALARAFATAR